MIYLSVGADKEMVSQLHIPGPMTIRQALSSATDRLAERNDLAPTAHRDAELLLLHALALPRTTIYSHPGRLLNRKEQTSYAATIERRLAFEPVQYITGTQEFFGLAFEVGPGVLIPRPETELLVEAALDRLPRDQPIEILDVGTGTGAIAIALASRLPQAKITAVDLSATALEIAGRNVRRYNFEDRIELLESDLLESLQTSESRFDAILSNPPYVPQGDRAEMHPQVRDYEPALALFAGRDGLEIYRRLIPQAKAALRKRGLLAMEIGYRHREAIGELLAGWNGVQFLDDLQGIPRVAVARKA